MGDSIESIVIMIPDACFCQPLFQQLLLYYLLYSLTILWSQCLIISFWGKDDWDEVRSYNILEVTQLVNDRVRIWALVSLTLENSDKITVCAILPLLGPSFSDSRMRQASYSGLVGVWTVWTFPFLRWGRVKMVESQISVRGGVQTYLFGELCDWKTQKQKDARKRARVRETELERGWQT